MATRIKNINHLQQRINKTKADCKSMENELDKRWEHLQNNYIGMAANSAIYGFIKSPKSFGVAKDVLSGIWNSENIKEFLKKTALRLLHAIAVKLGFKIVRDFAESKMAGKADEKNTPPEPKPEETNEE